VSGDAATPLAVVTVNVGEVEMAAMKGAVPPVHDTLTLLKVVPVTEGVGATA